MGYTYMRLDGYRARQSFVGLSAHSIYSYIPQHICTLASMALHATQVQFNFIIILVNNLAHLTPSPTPACTLILG